MWEFGQHNEKRKQIGDVMSDKLTQLEEKLEKLEEKIENIEEILEIQNDDEDQDEE